MTLVERLRAVESDPIGDGLANNRYRNPDGPEAAERIEALEAELERVRSETLAVVVYSNDSEPEATLHADMAAVHAYLLGEFDAPDSSGDGMDAEERERFDEMMAELERVGYGHVLGRDRWKERAEAAAIRAMKG